MNINNQHHQHRVKLWTKNPTRNRTKPQNTPPPPPLCTALRDTWLVNAEATCGTQQSRRAGVHPDAAASPRSTPPSVASKPSPPSSPAAASPAAPPALNAPLGRAFSTVISPAFKHATFDGAGERGTRRGGTHVTAYITCDGMPCKKKRR